MIYAVRFLRNLVLTIKNTRLEDDEIIVEESDFSVHGHTIYSVTNVDMNFSPTVADIYFKESPHSPVGVAINVAKSDFEVMHDGGVNETVGQRCCGK